RERRSRCGLAGGAAPARASDGPARRPRARRTRPSPVRARAPPRPRAGLGNALDTREQAGAEAVGQAIGVEDPLRRGGDVVLDALELEGAAVAVEDRVAGARIMVARLPDGADRDDVAELGAELEVLGDDFVDPLGAERIRLA